MSTLVADAPLQLTTRSKSAVSDEAEVVRSASDAVVQAEERSFALFGAKADSISQIWALVTESREGGGDDADPISDGAAEQAADFIRALPEDVPLPEFAWEPEGSISLDWIRGRHRVFSLGIGESPYLPYAWVDGTDRGYAVAFFDGEAVPPRILEGIGRTTGSGGATVWPH